MDTIRICIAEDHEIRRAGLRTVLSQEQDLAVAGEAEDTKELYKLIEKETPDILLLGLTLPDKERIQVLKDITRRTPSTRTLLLLDQVSEPELLQLFQAGAKGCLQTNLPTAVLKKAIRIVAGGEYWIDRKIVGKIFSEFLVRLDPPQAAHSAAGLLTKREVEILKMLARGCKNKEIAVNLYISEKTVKTHLTHIFEKLKIKGRLQAALYALQNRIEA